MAVDSAISSIANSSSSYSATSKGKTSGSDLDKEAFLNLLVTQMQYQDPLNPSDNTEYMSQLAQYSALEAQLNISDTLDKGNNLNLVGKYVIMNTTDSSGKQPPQYKKVTIKKDVEKGFDYRTITVEEITR